MPVVNEQSGHHIVLHNHTEVVFLFDSIYDIDEYYKGNSF